MQLQQTAFFSKLLFFFFLTRANCSTLGVTNEQGLNPSWAALSGEAISPSQLHLEQGRGVAFPGCFSYIVLLGLPSRMHSWFGLVLFSKEYRSFPHTHGGFQSWYLRFFF